MAAVTSPTLTSVILPPEMANGIRSGENYRNNTAFSKMKLIHALHLTRLGKLRPFKKLFY